MKAEATALRYHLVGIAGVGMSALAQALLNAGHVVTGSDRFLDQGRENLGVLETLRRAGAKLFPQDGSGITAQTTAVVVSTAIEADNPDLAAAKKFGVPVRHRAELLAELVAGKKLLAIAGTAGKTTTTALVGHLLTELGADPSVINGGVVLGWQRPDALGSARKGRADLWVLETDESDRSLLCFAPDWAIITNISKDHFELNEVVALFRQFAAQVKTGIICGPGVAELIRGHTSAVLIEPKLAESPRCGASFVEATSGRFSLDTRQDATSMKPPSKHAHVVEAAPDRFSEEERPEVASTLPTGLQGDVEALSRRLSGKWPEAASTLPHFFDPHESVAKLSGNLPHWRQQGVTYFVTFRTADSLPQEKLERWTRERSAWLQQHQEPLTEAEQQEYRELFTRRFEAWMDAGYGACLLARPDIRGVVEGVLRYFAGERYRLDEFVVMPNHVHVLVAPLGEQRLSQIIRSWKTFSAREIRKLMGQTGGFWQKEYFDHIVRNTEQLGRIRAYIRDNPRKLLASGAVEANTGRLPSEKRPEAASTLPTGSSVAASTYRTNLPGRHNAENVLLAATLCEQLGYAPEKIRAALATFQGIHRRLEKAGEVHGVTVFDDYAHNPAKIAAACAAVQPEHGRLFAVWRPHGFGPLKLMLGELTDALAGVLRPQDAVLLLPVFYAGGTTSSALNSDALVEALVARGVAAQLAPDYMALETRLRAVWRPGDVVLVMGARDPDLPLFARRLATG